MAFDMAHVCLICLAVVIAAGSPCDPRHDHCEIQGSGLLQSKRLLQSKKISVKPRIDKSMLGSRDEKILDFLAFNLTGNVTVNSNEECEDKISQCGDYQSWGYCGYAQFESYLQYYCAASCQFCVAEGVPAPAPTPAPCVDEKPTANCEYWRDYGFCPETHVYGWFMKKYCALTCAHCGAASDETETSSDETSSDETSSDETSSDETSSDETSSDETDAGSSGEDLEEWQRKVLTMHNIYRCMHGVPPLEWSSAVAGKAQGWADETEGEMEHGATDDCIDGSPCGQNLVGLLPQWGYDEVRGVQMWYDEIEVTPNGEGVVSSFGSSTGHYTQVVWRATEKLGCGEYVRDECTNTKGQQCMLTCDYYPAGNYGGQFGDNVNAPVKTYDECAEEVTSS